MSPKLALPDASGNNRDLQTAVTFPLQRIDRLQDPRTMNTTPPTDHQEQTPGSGAHSHSGMLARLGAWLAARYGEHEQRLQALRVYGRKRVDRGRVE